MSTFAVLTSIRDALAASGAQRLAENIAGTWARLLPGLAAVGSPVVRDDREANVLEFELRYELPGFGTYERGTLTVEAPEVRAVAPASVADGNLDRDRLREVLDAHRWRRTDAARAAADTRARHQAKQARFGRAFRRCHRRDSRIAPALLRCPR